MEKIIDTKEELVVDIARGAAEYIAERCVSESLDIEKAVDMMHDVVRHMSKKLHVEKI